MDGSDESYQLLGNFGAGQAMYRVAQGFPIDSGILLLEFLPARGNSSSGLVQSVGVPNLGPTESSLGDLSW